uniref:Putative secreted protein n=1 Tax=Rhipicephalus microplus TaxID=6941 RepID=A0A6G5A1P0_RHIMP
MNTIVLLQLCLTFLLLMNFAYGRSLFSDFLNRFGESQQGKGAGGDFLNNLLGRGANGEGPSAGFSGGPWIDALKSHFRGSPQGEGTEADFFNKIFGRGANGKGPNSDLPGGPFINTLMSRLGQSQQEEGTDEGLISRLIQRGATGVGRSSGLSEEEEEE